MSAFLHEVEQAETQAKQLVARLTAEGKSREHIIGALMEAFDGMDIISARALIELEKLKLDR